jgi:hypothetical protein
MYLYELEFDPKVGYDVSKRFRIDFDPSAHTTKEAAAKALYEALVKENARRGGPDGEVFIKSPEERWFGQNGWVVCWESGPYQWATSCMVSGPWGFCEPYYGFDLCFTD